MATILCILLMTFGSASAVTAEGLDRESIGEKSLTGSNWELFPRNLFLPLIAEIRESQFSMRRERYNTPEEKYAAAAVSFGEYLPLVEYQSGKNKYQFGIDAVVYSLFNLNTPSYNLVNSDYLFAMYLSQGNGPFTSRLKIQHVSSHLGDEFLLDNPGFERKNSSYEDSELLISYQPNHWRWYGGGGYIFRSNSLVALDPWHFRIGGERRRSLEYRNMDSIFAFDVELAERTNWSFARSVLAGVVLIQRENRELRLLANYYRGGSPQGQFFADKIEYFGLGLYFVI